jgi:hypothetical protein
MAIWVYNLKLQKNRTITAGNNFNQTAHLKKELIMKRIVTACVLAVFSLIIVASFAFAEETWRKTVHQDSDFWSESYGMKLPKANCLISVSKNGKKISVNAIDYDHYGKMLGQTVIIDSEKKTIKTYMHEVMDDQRFIRSDAHGYDIFYVKYLPHAKKLPPEIRAKFIGQWGIE